MIEQAKFIYFLFGKPFEKQTKSFEVHGRKQAEFLQF